MPIVSFRFSMYKFMAWAKSYGILTSYFYHDRWNNLLIKFDLLISLLDRFRTSLYTNHILVPIQYYYVLRSVLHHVLKVIKGKPWCTSVFSLDFHIPSRCGIILVTPTITFILMIRLINIPFGVMLANNTSVDMLLFYLSIHMAVQVF